VDLIEDDDDNNVDERTHYSPRTTGPYHVTQKSTQDLYPSLIELYQRTHSDKTHPSLGQNNDIDAKGPTSPPLSDRWWQDRYPDMASEESEAVADLLHKIFRYEPTERLATREILKHPWITRYCMGNLVVVS
jgi:serine/threonine protein kinase